MRITELLEDGTTQVMVRIIAKLLGKIIHRIYHFLKQDTPCKIPLNFKGNNYKLMKENQERWVLNQT